MKLIKLRVCSGRFSRAIMSLIAPLPKEGLLCFSERVSAFYSKIFIFHTSAVVRSALSTRTARWPTRQRGSNVIRLM